MEQGQTNDQTGKTLGEPINEEIGRDESWFARVASEKDAWFSNQKRTFDAYQQAEMEQLRLQNQYLQKVLSDAGQQNNVLQNIVAQALQSAVTTSDMVAKNALETANMIGKQSVRHGDIAIDNEWNPVQQSAGDSMLTKAVQLDDASVKAIAAALAAAFSQTVATKA
jgi:hypothetical protein